MIDDQLRAEFDVWIDTVWSFSGLIILICTGHVVQAKRQERLPRVLECLTHRALDAAIVLSDHLLHEYPIVVHLPVCSLVLLQAVKVESVATLRERHTCLVLFVDHIVELQLLHNEIVPFNVWVFRHGNTTMQAMFRLSLATAYRAGQGLLTLFFFDWVRRWVGLFGALGEVLCITQIFQTLSLALHSLLARVVEQLCLG